MSETLVMSTSAAHDEGWPWTEPTTTIHMRGKWRRYRLVEADEFMTDHVRFKMVEIDDAPKPMEVTDFDGEVVKVPDACPFCERPRRVLAETSVIGVFDCGTAKNFRSAGEHIRSRVCERSEAEMLRARVAKLERELARPSTEGA